MAKWAECSACVPCWPDTRMSSLASSICTLARSTNLRSRSEVCGTSSRGRIATTPVECGSKCITVSTRPWGLEYAANSGAPSVSRRVSLDT